jgi:1,4-alpha-glucan branching enzyme
MPGDHWQKLANLRAYFSYMWAHPGKKLLFMGGELAQDSEWNNDWSVSWHLLDRSDHAGVQKLVRKLNHLYQHEPALQFGDTEPGGFEWAVVNDAENSVIGMLRRSEDGRSVVLAVSNFTPVPRQAYRIGVPREGRWSEILNSDGLEYGGSGVGTGDAWSEHVAAHGRSHSVNIALPPLATVYLRWTAE